MTEATLTVGVGGEGGSHESYVAGFEVGRLCMLGQVMCVVFVVARHVCLASFLCII